MSKTMTTTKQSLIELTESIQLKDIITFQVNTEFLNQNFTIVKECLLKVQELQNDIGKERAQKQTITTMFNQLQNRIKQSQRHLHEHDNKIKELQNNIGDDFMKKLYYMQTKIKNTFDFDETLKKLQQLNKFVLTEKSFELENKINGFNDQIAKIRNQLDRFVEKNQFDQYKDSQADQLSQIRQQINKLNNSSNSNKVSIEKIQKQCRKACEQVSQNSRIIGQMNFTELVERVKKFKQDIDHKVGELSIKLKKKCGINDLNQLETNIIQRLDKFFAANQKGKASLNETKDALMYLEKRLNQIFEILLAKQNDEENQALFSTKKVNCASCTKDLGKFEGKLGQYRPWAVFPCKQLDPQKAGGLGYLNYVDKVYYRKGSTPDDSNLERLSRTFNNEKIREEESPKKMNTARTTNYMSSYGDQNRQSLSLKEQYFKEIKNDKSAGNRFFRVKKELGKPSTAFESGKQKVKQI